MQVLITAPFPTHLLDKLQAVSVEIELEKFTMPRNGWPEDKATSAEVLYTTAGAPRPEKARNLRWVQSHTAGVDHLRDELATISVRDLARNKVRGAARNC